jgi:hypothetical protein
MSQESLEGLSVQAPVEMQQTEQMIPQSKVNELIVNAKHAAAEKARRDVLQMQQQQQSYAPDYNQNSAPQSQQYSAPDLRNTVSEEVQRALTQAYEKEQERRDQEEIKQIASTYFERMRSSPNYEEQKTVLESFPHDRYTGLAYLASQFDNTGDIIYELATNDIKKGAMLSIAETDPEGAFNAMRKISESIKLNENAKNQQRPNEPMSQITPSSNSLDNGSNSVADLRKMMRNR